MPYLENLKQNEVLIHFAQNPTAPTYVWQFLPTDDLDENEHLDVQFSLSRHSFGDYIGRLAAGQSLLIALNEKATQAPLDLGYPNNPNNWSFPVRHFKQLKLQFIKEQPFDQHKVVINGDNIEIYINAQEHMQLVVWWHNGHTSPILYTALLACVITENGETRKANICLWPQDDEQNQPFFA